jgi:hypothetical protein
MNCVVQTVEQGAAAGSASGAVALLATGLSALGSPPPGSSGSPRGA